MCSLGSKESRFLHATAKTPIRLGECQVCSESSLGAHVILLALSAAAQMIVKREFD